MEDILQHLLFQLMSDSQHCVIESLLDQIDIPFNILSHDKTFITTFSQRWIKLHAFATQKWKAQTMYWHKMRFFVEKFGHTIVMKKVIPMFSKQFRNFCKPAKQEIANLIIEIMKMPNFEIQLEMCDFIMKNLV